jgi:hypothetical protein
MSALDDILQRLSQTGPDGVALSKEAVKDLIVSLIQDRNKELIARYVDETDAAAKAANAQHDYVRYHLTELLHLVQDL